jgi:hypothetical protein
MVTKYGYHDRDRGLRKLYLTEAKEMYQVATSATEKAAKLFQTAANS